MNERLEEAARSITVICLMCMTTFAIIAIGYLAVIANALEVLAGIK